MRVYRKYSEREIISAIKIMILDKSFHSSMWECKTIYKLDRIDLNDSGISPIIIEQVEKSITKLNITKFLNFILYVKEREYYLMEEKEYYLKNLPIGIQQSLTYESMINYMIRVLKEWEGMDGDRFLYEELVNEG